MLASKAQGRDTSEQAERWKSEVNYRESITVLSATGSEKNIIMVNVVYIIYREILKYL